MLKKEVRILGISAPVSRKRSKTIPIVGVVYRGNLWLDGVLTCLLKARAPNHLATLASTITHSKHYSQIRAVILSRHKLIQKADIDIAGLSRMLRLPVLSIVGTHDVRESTRQQRKGTSKSVRLNRYTITIGGASVRVASAGLTHNQACEIFAVGCAEGHSIPEAVRVADLIAKHLSSRVFTARSK
jgi:endonuclease V-like protein UPF0215 family